MKSFKWCLSLIAVVPLVMELEGTPSKLFPGAKFVLLEIDVMA